MQLEIRFRGLDPSEAVEERIRERVAQLEKVEPQLIHCRVRVELPNHRHRHGDLFEVHIELTGPGGVISVARGTPPPDHSHEDVYVAIRDAFDAVMRRVEDWQRRVRGEV